MQILIYSFCIKVFFICKKRNENKVSSVLLFFSGICIGLFHISNFLCYLEWYPAFFCNSLLLTCMRTWAHLFLVNLGTGLTHGVTDLLMQENKSSDLSNWTVNTIFMRTVSLSFYPQWVFSLTFKIRQNIQELKQIN